MSTLVERLWAPSDSSAGVYSRADKVAGRYFAYVPDELGDALPVLSDVARTEAEDALTVLGRADERIGRRGRLLNHLLIRSESISSSWIEGNRVTPKQLAIAEALSFGSRVARDVVANVHATEAAIATLADPSRPITVRDVVDLQHTIEPRLEWGLRTEQNWVGGPGWSPLRAEFVPPPESEVQRLVEDFARFVTDTRGNPVVRAAIAHAQFETIHPFVDGNGRTGRAFIHTVLRRAGALRNILIPISTVFAGSPNDYIGGLTAYRADPPSLDDWVIGFSVAARRAAQNSVKLADAVELVDARLAERLEAFRRSVGRNPVAPRSDSVVKRVLEGLSGTPVLTREGVAHQFECSSTAAFNALTELADAGVLSRKKDPHGRLLCWTSDWHLDLVAHVERSNRVGAGDTAIQRPRLGPPAPAFHPSQSPPGLRL